MNKPENSLIELEQVTKDYLIDSQPVHALKGISFCIRHNEFLALMGPSGSGKSTLMNILGCLDTPTSGRYLLENTDVSSMSDDALSLTRNQKIGFVFQSFNLLSRYNALENVMLPLIYAGFGKNERQSIAHEALQQVGLSDRIYHKPGELSGGQRQRVAIARAVVTRPLIILADEPTGNLDSKTSDEIMSLLCQLHESGNTIILVTHENEIARYASRIIRLRDGLIESDTAR